VASVTRPESLATVLGSAARSRRDVAQGSRSPAAMPQPGEVAHAACPSRASGPADQKVPPGQVYRAMDSGRMAAQKPGAVGAV